MTHPTLYLSSEDNQIYVSDMPDKPNEVKGKSIWYNRNIRTPYSIAYDKAIANKVLVKDQRSGIELLQDFEDYPNIKKDTPYPIDGYSVTILATTPRHE